MTFSVIARDARTGDLGVATQSRFLAVGALVCHAQAGVGALATQALLNPTYGERGLGLLRAGSSPAVALAALVADDELPGRRQAAIVDAAGRAAAHTGAGCQPWAGHLATDDVAVLGNMLVSQEVIESMARAVTENALEALPERLVAALEAGQAAGGDARGQQSAALLVVRAGGGYGGLTDRMVDLRVDDHREPIVELRRLLRLHRLYFSRPAAEDLIAIEPALAGEVARLLTQVLREPVDGAEPARLWAALDRWAGRENLEERMVKPGAIDRTVLDHLVALAGGSAVGRASVRAADRREEG